jgi:hypothetical protein
VLYNGYATGPIENMDILYIMNWFSLEMTYCSQNLLMWDDMTDYFSNNKVLSTVYYCREQPDITIS